MSRVYEYYLEMEEVLNEADYQDWLAQQSEESEQEYSKETKVEKFVKKMLEEQ